MEGRECARCGWWLAAVLALVFAPPHAGLDAGAPARQARAAIAAQDAWALAAAGDAPRLPRRNLERSSSFEWLPDVRSRLHALEAHAADAARERLRAVVEPSPSGQSVPRLPAAGDGSAR